MPIGRSAAAQAVLLIVAFAFVSIGAPRAVYAAGLWLQGAGATFPAPLYKRWIEVYEQEHPNIDLSYDAVGSGEGISRFVTGSVDFGASDAAPKDAQIAKVANGVVVVPATAGMVVLGYNLPGVDGPLKLPRDVYADIFAGKITKWDDPRLASANPTLKLPPRTIAIVARIDGSGTTAAFSTHLKAASKSWQEAGLGAGTLISWPSNVMLARGNEGVASRIKISENSIGYLEYGFAKRLGLPVAALQNKSGSFIMPTEQAGQAALAEGASPAPEDLRLVSVDPAGQSAYPIVTYSWLLFYRQYADPNTAAALKDFAAWGLGKGQVFARDLGYIPLPENIAARGEAALASIR